MHYKIKLFFVSLIMLGATQQQQASFSYATFEELDVYCIKNLPTLKTLHSHFFKIKTNEAIFINPKDYSTFRAIDLLEFELALDAFLSLMSSSLTNPTQWINEECYHYSQGPTQSPHMPFAQKVLCNSNDTIFLRGDMHGDIHSLLAFIRNLQANGHTHSENGFKIINPKLKVIFLGDYVDRGIYGAEVIYTILRFKLANPDQVILIRGNHEDLSLSTQFHFNNEIKYKFIDSNSNYMVRIFRKLHKLYETLPVVAYVGCPENKNLVHYVQCCHGGIEIGFNPQELLASPNHKQYQLLGELKQLDECEKLKSFLLHFDSIIHLKNNCQNIRPTKATSEEFINGFMWSDFQHDATAPFIIDRSFCYSKELTEGILQLASSDTHKLCGIFRAHQHTLSNDDPLMQQMLSSHGVARLWTENSGHTFSPWQGIVCTLLLSPDNAVAIKPFGFGGFDFDTTVKIQLQPQFTDWCISVINVDIYEQLSRNLHFDESYTNARGFMQIESRSSNFKSPLDARSLFTTLGTYGIYNGLHRLKNNHIPPPIR